MKRTGYLFEKIVSKDNIILAIHNATKNKKSKRGIIKDAAENPERYADKIREKLISGNYYFAPADIKNSAGAQENQAYKSAEILSRPDYTLGTYASNRADNKSWNG